MLYRTNSDVCVCVWVFSVIYVCVCIYQGFLSNCLNKHTNFSLTSLTLDLKLKWMFLPFLAFSESEPKTVVEFLWLQAGLCSLCQCVLSYLILIWHNLLLEMFGEMLDTLIKMSWTDEKQSSAALPESKLWLSKSSGLLVGSRWTWFVSAVSSFSLSGVDVSVVERSGALVKSVCRAFRGENDLYCSFKSQFWMRLLVLICNVYSSEL